ncbi:hypothetical protein R69749_08269 [Paraburkholderia domus]|nr:hypothetical protein R69619_07669 [Paraburkholderia nemoris]CAE6903237.1 hypothetical protein R69749_08269 [Paraburkholderia domus]
MLRTMGFPGQHLQGPKALLELGSLLKRRGFRRPLAPCDAVVNEKVWPCASAAISDAGLAGECIEFPGECTKSAITHCRWKRKRTIRKLSSASAAERQSIPPRALRPISISL